MIQKLEEILYPHQIKAVHKLHNGSILCGGVGTGKSLTALGYYWSATGGKMDVPLIIITTAHKRDSKEWDAECLRFGIPELCNYELVVDSWNNIERYKDVTGCFVIFDEHKAIGSGKWAKLFVKVARNNQWILLTATPGDRWLDYCSVFVANGFFANRTQFIARHVIQNPFVNYFSVKEYIHVDELIKMRDYILVDMPYRKPATKEEIPLLCEFNKEQYGRVMKERWDIYNDCPITNAAALCYVLRRIVNSDESRVKRIVDICNRHNRVIIFYNFDYELELLKNALRKMAVTEWNGHKHDNVSEEPRWAHLVQYSAGAEGWNCISTNVMVFYSQSYSYKMTEQAKGRIDRLNTPYDTLYYYILHSSSDIDKAISRSLLSKKEFNADRWLKGVVFNE